MQDTDPQHKLITAQEQEARQRLTRARRIAVKVGTSTLTYEDGSVDLSNFERLCRALANQMNQGKEVILISSGAIAVGMKRLRETKRPRSLRDKQAMAAIGQADLINLYAKIMAEYGHIVGQILLTRDDVDDPVSRENLINTFEALLEKGVMPIVNENDSVSTQEVLHKGTFGDNDRLSAIVARLCGADALILLSDIDGLYDHDPRLDGQADPDLPPARLISYVPELTPEIEKLAGGSGTSRGTGGMQTKIAAARMATENGIDFVIAQGHRPENIVRILAGESVGTLFRPVAGENPPPPEHRA